MEEDFENYRGGNWDWFAGNLEMVIGDGSIFFMGRKLDRGGSLREFFLRLYRLNLDKGRKVWEMEAWEDGSWVCSWR